jgi:hypothetical protein
MIGSRGTHLGRVTLGKTIGIYAYTLPTARVYSGAPDSVAEGGYHSNGVVMVVGNEVEAIEGGDCLRYTHNTIRKNLPHSAPGNPKRVAATLDRGSPDITNKSYCLLAWSSTG